MTNDARQLLGLFPKSSSSVEFAGRWLASLIVGGCLVLLHGEAHASPGVCSCTAGCQYEWTACLVSSQCNVGYQPLCRFEFDPTACRTPTANMTRCTGICNCVKIAGFCELVGGAEYCPEKDAGHVEPPPDSSSLDVSAPDTEPADTFAPDTISRDDGPRAESSVDGPAADVSGSDGTSSDVTDGPSGLTDGPAADVTSSNDGFTPADAPDDLAADSREFDSAVSPGDAVTPADGSAVDAGCGPTCPEGTGRVPIPGRCDVYCAQPCSGGETQCFGGGTRCVDGFCVPICLITPCERCERCNLVTGMCFEDATCGDSGLGPSWDAGGTADATVHFPSSDAIADAATDVVLDSEPAVVLPGPAALPATGDDSGCGCVLPGVPAARSSVWGAPLVGIALAALVRRRRRVNGVVVRPGRG